MLRSVLFAVVALLLLVSCGKSPQSAGQTAGVSTNERVFEVKGVVKAIRPAKREIEIKHETIPGYMQGMTMPFEVKDTNELAGLQPEQPISFRLTVTDTDGWVDHIRGLGPPIASAPVPDTNQPVQVAEPLHPGDPMPTYHLTNELGQAITTTQFKGQALAITFLFTRCPFPTFCPRLANDFAETQQKLLARTTGPRNWHLLTISIDPEFDQPEILKAYAKAHDYDPAHWTFATGNVQDIAAFGDRFGLAFWRDSTGSVTHNMRTVVVDAKGHLQKVFEGKDWTSADLVAEIIKAAKP